MNWICSLLMYPFGIRPGQESEDQLTSEELRTLVNESGLRLPTKRRGMLLGILDLEKVRVDDIMVPRNEISGIDIEDDIEDIIHQLKECQHTRVPVYRGDINNVVGMLHMRKIARLLSLEQINKATLLQETDEPYFIPETTALHTQLFNFQKARERTALVVDEYGDIIGLATLEDILEEIVGEIADEHDEEITGLHVQVDGSVIVDGTLPIRDLNRALDWQLPDEEATTVAGLVIHEAQMIPTKGQVFSFHGFRFEVTEREANRITRLKVRQL